mmetsp:Transcript_22806/g.73552  ORF Transcript_22806/g.73552 Transcript_22806/m.73552 type:complete len:257 (+) Transcript_22806:501-1271(+)
MAASAASLESLCIVRPAAASASSTRRRSRATRRAAAARAALEEGAAVWEGDAVGVAAEGAPHRRGGTARAVYCEGRGRAKADGGPGRRRRGRQCCQEGAAAGVARREALQPDPDCARKVQGARHPRRGARAGRDGAQAGRHRAAARVLAQCRGGRDALSVRRGPASQGDGAVGPCRVLPARHGRRAAPEPAARLLPVEAHVRAAEEGRRGASRGDQQGGPVPARLEDAASPPRARASGGQRTQRWHAARRRRRLHL